MAKIYEESKLNTLCPACNEVILACLERFNLMFDSSLSLLSILSVSLSDYGFKV